MRRMGGGPGAGGGGGWREGGSKKEGREKGAEKVLRKGNRREDFILQPLGLAPSTLSSPRQQLTPFPLS